VEIIRSSILLQGSIIETFLEKHVSNLQIHEQFSNNQTIRCDTNMVRKKKMSFGSTFEFSAQGSITV
jgi:hypothetical protein